MFRKKIGKQMIVGLAISLAAIIYFLFDPLQHRFFLFCPLHHFTGLKCPLCGAQQMFHHLLHGQLFTAFHDNPFLFILLPYIILFIYLSVSGKKDKYLKIYKRLYGDRTLLILLIVAAVFGVARNII